MTDSRRFAAITDAQLYVYAHRPLAYASIAATIDLCMMHGTKPCIGDYGCDEDAPCPRHRRTLDVAERLVRMRAKARGRAVG